MDTILSPLDAADLERRGLLDRGTTTGTGLCRIHKRRLNTLSDEEYREISLDISPSSNAADEAFAVIPEVLISRQTLSYVGFSKEKATEIWGQWVNWPLSGPRREIDADDRGLVVTFLSFAIGTLDSRTDVIDDNDDQWRACLQANGINLATQDGIMDPRFNIIRLSDSCLGWARDTIEMRYAGLGEIQRTSRLREMEIRRSMLCQSHSGGGGSTNEQATQPHMTRDAQPSADHAQRSVSALQQTSLPGTGSDS